MMSTGPLRAVRHRTLHAEPAYRGTSWAPHATHNAQNGAYFASLITVAHLSLCGGPGRSHICCETTTARGIVSSVKLWGSKLDALPEAMTNTTTMRAVHRGCPLTQTLKPPKPPPHLAYDSRSAVFEPSSIVCRASINCPWDINPTPRHLPSGGSGPAAKPQTTGRFFRRISLSGQPLASSRHLIGSLRSYEVVASKIP